MTDPATRARPTLEIALISLLWPPTVPAPRGTPSPKWAVDLGLDDLVRAFNPAPRHTAFIRATLDTLTSDPAVIEWRAAVLADFTQNPPLVEAIDDLLPRLADLRADHVLLGRRQRGLLLETADRLAELDLYLSIVQELGAALDAATLHSEALRGLRGMVAALKNDANFVALQAEMPALRRPLQTFASLTIGVNLDAQLQPIAATLLSVNERPFGELRSFLGRLLGARGSDQEAGIAPLHRLPSEHQQRILTPLFQDLERLITTAIQPVARALGRYVRVSSAPLAGLENEMAFYVAAVGLRNRLEARGIALCQPTIAPASERLSQIDGLINIHLALRTTDRPITNDLTFDDVGRIGILTGPNSGGKTTYLQAVGLAHVLFQAGLFIPATAARISPVDAILTHFPALETRQQGRLAEEAERLREIFLYATESSLALLNESLASTTPGEGLHLAQDVLCGLRLIGVRALFATHLIELATRIEAIEATVSGKSRLMSLVAGVNLTEDGHALPTFQITRGLPLGSGYAHEIARQHGITLPQIIAARAAQNGRHP